MIITQNYVKKEKKKIVFINYYVYSLRF